jgi:hypothetical protein
VSLLLSIPAPGSPVDGGVDRHDVLGRVAAARDHLEANLRRLQESRSRLATTRLEGASSRADRDLAAEVVRRASQRARPAPEANTPRRGPDPHRGWSYGMIGADRSSCRVPSGPAITGMV